MPAARRTASSSASSSTGFARCATNPAARDSARSLSRSNPLSTIVGGAGRPVRAATDTARARRFVDELWNAPIPSGQYRYYDGMWYLMGLLHCAGEFRIWAPEGVR